MEELEMKRMEYEAVLRRLQELQNEIAKTQTKAVELQGVIKYLMDKKQETSMLERPEITD